MELLPVVTVATLSIGLKGDSRIMKKMTGQKINDEPLLLAGILDKLSFIAWTKTKDAQHGRNRPESIVNKLLNEGKSEKEFEVFSSGDDLMARLNQLREGIKECQN